MRVRIAARAKINLTLDVIDKLPNGYHELLMVMQSIDLHDTLMIETGTGEGINLRCNLASLPCDDTNLISKAVKAYYSATGIINDGVSVALEKRIPVMAGLAGGSTNAAAVLRALDFIHNSGLSDKELHAIGLTVGADVPFCVSGGTMLARGVGDVLKPLRDMAECNIVLVKPGVSVSTAYVFSELDKKIITHRPDTNGMIEALERGSLEGTAGRLFNVMEMVTAENHPEICVIKQKLIDFGALGAVMSGSGPSVFGIFADNNSAYKAYAAMLPEYPAVYLCRPSGRNSAADIEIM